MCGGDAAGSTLQSSTLTLSYDDVTNTVTGSYFSGLLNESGSLGGLFTAPVGWSSGTVAIGGEMRTSYQPPAVPSASPLTLGMMAAALLTLAGFRLAKDR